MGQLRKMTMGEVAEIAGDPKETVRARINRGLTETKKTPGWARFDLPSSVQIAVHAEVLRRTESNHQIAIHAANFAGDSLANFCNFPPRTVQRRGQLAGCYMFFRHHDSGVWTSDWRGSQQESLRLLGEYVAESDVIEAAGFYFLNIGAVVDWALDRVFDLQGIDGGEATT